MTDILLRSLSQGLQAFVPVLFCLAWARRAGLRDRATGIRWGLLAALPATVVAGYLFQTSVRQALWEASLAAAAVVPAVWFAGTVWRDRAAPVIAPVRQKHLFFLVVAVVTSLVIARQTMLIAAVLSAALALRSLDAMRAVCGGVLAAVAIAILVSGFARRLSRGAFVSAARACAVIFLGQLAMYAFHKSSEARLLPWSDVLEAATEPYGPDGVYGLYISCLLVVAPIGAAAITIAGNSFGGGAKRWGAATHSRALAIASATMLVVAIVVSIGIGGGVTHGSVAAAHESTSVRAHLASTITTGPHLLFRHVRIDQAYGTLGVAPLASPGADRANVELGCERVSFSAGVGICLQAERKMFTAYQAVLFDAALRPRRAMKLEGLPSRTRISADGRVGAVTVFVAGEPHGYMGGSFATKTTLIDMASGDLLGDLEQFATWRNGSRFEATDFNFWGVTFARDSNVFYATLKTGRQTYLVRGDLGLRKMTVMRENVECPSLSPDNHLIAFKKRVGPDTAPWRFYVLDLATMTERPLAAEARSIDDQIEWLDNDHVLYAVSRSTQPAIRDVWIAPLDGNGPARVFLPEAESPIVVH